MKKSMVVVLSTAILLSVAFNVYSASVSFEPHKVELKIASGQTGRTALTVHGFSSTSYSLNFLVGSRLQQGNIPQGWITAAYLWLDSKTEGSSTATMDLVVSVPPKTAAGTYTGVLVPDDMRSSEPITSKGVLIAIEVLAP